MTRLLRFRDLKARGICNDRVRLKRLIDQYDFPPGQRMGATRIWTEEVVDTWIAALPDASEVRPTLRGAVKKLAKRQAQIEAAE